MNELIYKEIHSVSGPIFLGKSTIPFRKLNIVTYPEKTRLRKSLRYYSNYLNFLDQRKF